MLEVQYNCADGFFFLYFYVMLHFFFLSNPLDMYIYLKSLGRSDKNGNKSDEWHIKLFKLIFWEHAFMMMGNTLDRMFEYILKWNDFIHIMCLSGDINKLCFITNCLYQWNYLFGKDTATLHLQYTQWLNVLLKSCKRYLFQFSLPRTSLFKVTVNV